MATTTLSPQLKLRGIFFSDDSPENPTTTTTAGDIFSDITSAITTFFDYLINLFNQKLPPETRDEQIHRFLDGATPYLIVAGVLITCLCCWCCIFPCVSCIVVGLFNVVCSVFGCVFACVRCVVVAIFNGVCSVLRCVGSCLCCGVRSSRKMMKAPGKPSLKIPRGAFEGNPRGYFRSLCGMEVDEIQSLQVSKFQRVSSNGSTTSTDNSSNPQKLASNRGNFELQNHVDVVVGGVGGGGGGGVRLCGWPSSRIVRVSRASGGKDRHSKVLTSKGLRDRRVRLSVGTAIQFYDLQDRLGYDQPSKAVEWLLKAAASSIDELPSLDPPFSGGISDRKVTGDGNDNVCSQAKSPACSSTSETSKGSGLSLSRSENRIKARERAREMASKKEKEKEIDSTRVSVLNQVNHMPENSTFTDLLTGGINTTTTTTNTNDYLFTRTLQPSPNLIQIPQFNNHHHHQQPPLHHHFSFLQDTFAPATGGGAGGGDSYSLNFAMTASPTGAVALGGFSRGTLQSNLQSSLLPHHHHHHLQRFQSSSIDVPTSSNLPFFIVPNATVDHYPAAGGYHLSYGGDGGGRRSDHQKEKSKN